MIQWLQITCYENKFQGTRDFLTESHDLTYIFISYCMFLVTALSEVEKKPARGTIRYRVVCALYLRGQLVRCICDEGAARNGVPECDSTLKAI
jgi:hypothetical protein